MKVTIYDISNLCGSEVPFHFYTGQPQDDFIKKPKHVDNIVNKKDCLIIKLCIRVKKIVLIKVRKHGVKRNKTDILPFNEERINQQIPRDKTKHLLRNE